MGTYEVLAPLGAGGMGEVYRARDSKLDRDVALKVLPSSVANDADALGRFEREAKAVAALSHHNILAIFPQHGSGLGMAGVRGGARLIQLARIYALAGEPEKAVDVLERLLKMPSNTSPAWLAINPYFEPLRKDPRFQALIAKS